MGKTDASLIMKANELESFENYIPLKKRLQLKMIYVIKDIQVVSRNEGEDLLKLKYILNVYSLFVINYLHFIFHVYLPFFI